MSRYRSTAFTGWLFTSVVCVQWSVSLAGGQTLTGVVAPQSLVTSCRSSFGDRRSAEVDNPTSGHRSPTVMSVSGRRYLVGERWSSISDRRPAVVSKLSRLMVNWWSPRPVASDQCRSPHSLCLCPSASNRPPSDWPPPPQSPARCSHLSAHHGARGRPVPPLGLHPRSPPAAADCIIRPAHQPC